MAWVILGAICMAYPFILMVAHPPAQDALVDPGLVDEPDQGDDQLDGGQDVEDQTPECHYEMTTYILWVAVQQCGEVNYKLLILGLPAAVILSCLLTTLFSHCSLCFDFDDDELATWIRTCQ